MAMNDKLLVYFPLSPLQLNTNKKALEADGPLPLLLVPAFKETGKLQLPFPQLSKGPKEIRRERWSSKIQAKGPMGLLLQSLHACGASMGGDFIVRQHQEPDLDIIKTPWQHLGLLV